jgi:integrase/recombinase XerC
MQGLPFESVGGERDSAASAALSRLLGAGVRPLRLEETVFEAALEGWWRQQGGRHLRESKRRARELVVRRFRERSERWPWEWRAIDVDEWVEDLGAPPRPRAVSTLRNYQGALRTFLDYLADDRYPWVAICERHFGLRPMQVLFEENLIRRVSDYEGDPSRRPFTREELVVFFDYCDERVNRLRRQRRKGSLAALRDGAAFKALYAWGLRRQEAARLDVTDLGRNPERPSYGRYGMVGVRYGKASRGNAPKRRNVATVFDWSAEVIGQYLEEVRPRYGRDEHPALFLTERGGRLSPGELTLRFAECRDGAGLPSELSPHAMRHSYVTHLIEDGWDELFVRMQVGHRYASTTALYTGVSGDFKNDAMRRALRRQLGEELGPERR